MNRYLPPILVVLMIAGAALTYDTKHKAEKAAADVASLRGQVEREKTALRLLKAEWSVLTQPARLQALVEKYQAELGLQTADVSQFVTIDDVPTRFVDIDAALDEATGATGSVAPRGAGRQ